MCQVVLVVILIQAEVVTSHVTLQRVLVKQNLLVTHQTPVERLQQEVAWCGLHVLEELRGENPVVRPHVTVKPPLLGEDSLAADVPAPV